MTARTVIISGATSGLGLATAQALLERGEEVVILGPDEPQVRAARASLGIRTGTEPTGYACDLRSMAGVEALASRLLAAHPRVDVLINNAGVLMQRPQTTAEGRESTWAVNYLATWLLSVRLLPGLRAAPRGRIVNLCSSSHRIGRLRLDQTQREGPFSGLQSYADSKLAVALFTRALAARLRQETLTCNCIHPGVVTTSIGHGHGVISRLMRLGKRFLTPPDQACEAVVRLACNPAHAGTTGCYFDRFQRATPAPRALDDALSEKLWHHTLRSLEVRDPFAQQTPQPS